MTTNVLSKALNSGSDEFAFSTHKKRYIVHVCVLIGLPVWVNLAASAGSRYQHRF